MIYVKGRRRYYPDEAKKFACIQEDFNDTPELFHRLNKGLEPTHCSKMAFSGIFILDILDGSMNIPQGTG